MKRMGARLGVESSRVRDDLDATIETGAHDLFHLSQKCARVSAARLFRLRTRQDQHRELGKPIAGQDVDRTALDHLARGRESISVEPRAVGDANHAGPALSSAFSGCM